VFEVLDRRTRPGAAIAGAARRGRHVLGLGPTGMPAFEEGVAGTQDLELNLPLEVGIEGDLLGRRSREGELTPIVVVVTFFSGTEPVTAVVAAHPRVARAVGAFGDVGLYLA
jgi:hypothetical protein